MYSPLKRSYLTQGYHVGKAIDLGWISLGLVNPPLHSFDDGIVAEVWFERSAGGNCVTIIHPFSDTHEILSLYGHLHRVDIVKGQKVFGNQEIGLGGRTGVASGPHLHYELWIVPKGYKFDKSNYFRTDRARYITDPFPLINWNGTDSRKLGDTKMYNIDFSFQGKATTTSTVLRMRTQPNLSSLTVGHMPRQAQCVGKVVGKFDGYEWVAIIHDNRIVFVASSFVKVEPNAKTVEVIKTVEVEKPINISTTIDGVSISIQKPIK